MSDDAIIKLQNVTKKIRSKTLVENLSFQVKKSEIVGLLGPNGSGKTTTMRMMVGIISITEGQVLINHVDISKDFEKAIEQVGSIIENPNFYPFLTGYENLLYFANMSKGVTKERVYEVIDLLGIKSAIHKKVKEYSLGMRQRLGIAQALLHKPAVLILDEPTNGLDPAGIREMRDYMKRIAQEEGTAILVSSHLISEIELMCDRAIIIQHGKFVAEQRIGQNVVENEKQRTIFKIDFPELAKHVLQMHEVEIGVSTISLCITLDQIPEVNALLVGEGIKVYGITQEKISLEDQFLEMTGGNQIV